LTGATSPGNATVDMLVNVGSILIAPEAVALDRAAKTPLVTFRHKRPSHFGALPAQCRDISSAILDVVVQSSPRLDPRLAAAAFALDDPSRPYAETWRAVGAVAAELGLVRPGYDTVRLLLAAHRRRRAEIRRLLEPVGVDMVKGHPTTWDLERLWRAAEIARVDRDARRRRRL